MIDEKRMAEIRKRLDEAQYGYGKVGYNEYTSDVKLLLAELDAVNEERAAAKNPPAKVLKK